MKPTLRKPLIASAIVLLGLVILVFVANWPLASLSTEYEGGRLELSLKKSRLGEWIYLDAEINRSVWDVGPRSVQLVGNLKDLGTKPPEIVGGVTKDEYLLKFEHRVFVFDAKTFDVR